MMTTTEQGQAVNMSHLTEADACQKNRDFNYVAKDTSQPENYFRTIVIKDTIRNALIYGVKDDKAVMQYMLTRYAECGFKNYQQKQAQLIYDHKRVMRYLKDEVRKPSFPKGGVVEIGTRRYMVRVDAAFECGDQIELVCFKIGKPQITQTGRNGAFQRDMQLYALQLFGRSMELAEKYGRTEPFKNITASFYYLKKTGDGPSWNQCDQHFFGGGGNIIQIIDLYDGTPNDLDKDMSVLIAANENGINPENEKEETCRYCDYYDICRYELPPVRMDTDADAADLPATAHVEFSPAQQEAIDVRSGITRIIAGAGSGKTKTIVARVEAMLSEGVKPEEICMMTFTKAGADEMKRRIEKDYGRQLPGLTVSTFNSFENDIVKDQWQALGFSRKPQVIDDVSRFSIIADLLNRNPIFEWTSRSFVNFSASKGYGTRGALRIAADVFTACKAAKAKNGIVNNYDVRGAASHDEINDAALSKLISLYDEYERISKERGLIDFDDQEILAFRVIENDPGYLAGTYKFSHIIIDEFQDTSEGQIEMIKKLITLPTFNSLMVVGDDFQSIYGFRDTTPEYIVHFEKYIGKPVRDIVLDMNYRSTPEICGFGNLIISPNRDKVEKTLVAARQPGAPVIVNGFSAKADEVEFIVKGIRQHMNNGIKPEDIAVIAYTKNELKAIADRLTKAGIPSMFGAPEPLAENSRIRAILAFARVIGNRDDTKAALVCANALMGGGIMDEGAAAVETKIGEVIEKAEMIDAATQHEKKDLFLKYIEEISFGDEAVSHFAETFENKDYDEIIDYCRDFSMYGDGVEYRRIEDYPGVALVTAHSSKGREWKVVYNTVTKYQKSSSMATGTIEETRRLLFVSATRARDELYITGQYYTGTKAHHVENRFLRESFDAAGEAWLPVI